MADRPPIAAFEGPVPCAGLFDSVCQEFERTDSIDSINRSLKKFLGEWPFGAYFLHHIVTDNGNPRQEAKSQGSL
ncbi:hypothetical protein D8780_04955 [Notoacmeibacter ruber]|uniref:Uncharacterized protein n=1 Tax=Notoacmeibacter ruber TaxID=2670375 RepID=A0A3L7JAZ8_9HYPH|nr:hypothetical protein D8780_04955 [Notoacmeibacter ruber]